jgi:hypothetical protein
MGSGAYHESEILVAGGRTKIAVPTNSAIRDFAVGIFCHLIFLSIGR